MTTKKLKQYLNCHPVQNTSNCSNVMSRIMLWKIQNQWWTHEWIAELLPTLVIIKKFHALVMPLHRDKTCSRCQQILHIYIYHMSLYCVKLNTGESRECKLLRDVVENFDVITLKLTSAKMYCYETEQNLFSTIT